MEQIKLADYSIFVGSIWQDLEDFLQQHNYSKIAVLVDHNTQKDCLPLLQQYLATFDLEPIIIPAGEYYKNIDTCQLIWSRMMDLKMDRKALLINLGGGVIGDMGGFCASTFKRGFDFIQIPTTLLSQVDASIGGKLGIDFMQIKNSIGLFKNPKAVFIDPIFLKTLPLREIRSGFAEIIKHSLIADHNQWLSILQINRLEDVNWLDYLLPSLKIKQRIVEEDPFEHGLRKALNFGHTIGHAVEGFALESENPLLHGEAIAIGMICEAYLSLRLTNLQQESFHTIWELIRIIYEPEALPAEAFEHYLALLRNDKKNEGASINFSLIQAPGQVIVNQTAEESLIIESLNYYNNLLKMTTTSI